MPNKQMVRIKQTQNEKFAAKALDDTVDRVSYNMSEKTIDNLIHDDAVAKFNEQVDQYVDKMNSHYDTFKKEAEKVDYARAEIKPMFSRLLILPFKTNPFQRVVQKGSLIVDTGALMPEVELNPNTGKYEENKPFIITACVVEIGPDVKYLREGDVIYYRVDTAVPVPFFKQGFYSIDEKQVICVVADRLTERFSK